MRYAQQPRVQNNADCALFEVLNVIVACFTMIGTVVISTIATILSDNNNQ